MGGDDLCRGLVRTHDLRHAEVVLFRQPRADETGVGALHGDAAALQVHRHVLGEVHQPGLAGGVANRSGQSRETGVRAEIAGGTVTACTTSRPTSADRTGDFGVGDVEIADPELDHTPVAGSAKPCVCIADTDAPLRFHGLLPRRLQPLFRI